MRLYWLIAVVDDDILSSFLLDDEGKNEAIIGGRQCFVVVEHCFICSAEY
jgi:hypothetical protein